MQENTWDALVLGAGSVGLPVAMNLAEAGKGDHKSALGGIRAAHSELAKIILCKRSLEIFSTWKELHGDDVAWSRGGYCFPAYTEADESALKSLLPMQQQHGLNVHWVTPERVEELVPGITKVASGAVFHTGERVLRIDRNSEGKCIGVTTDKAAYRASFVIDCLGGFTTPLMQASGISGPHVIPDQHQAAITEPVEPFFRCMVVDIREAPGSKSLYYYPTREGHIVFCITPWPPVVGTEIDVSSNFISLAARRLIALHPRLRDIKVQRIWAGLYPMSPDGSPLIGWNRDAPGLLHLAGMCGQGFMLGPALGELAARMLTGRTTDSDREVLSALDLYRTPSRGELLR